MPDFSDLSPHHQSDLPIEAVLPELRQALTQNHEAVLQAPPGAGKTTRVPLALLQEDWLQGQSILMLEPRRIAARNAAARMASALGESVGETVGYRVRLDSQVGPNTRIEVITEGILSRRLQNDPSLEGVGLVIFDEFHERSLDLDLGLSMTLHGRSLFRNPDEGERALKVLVMSATLEDKGISEVLSDKVRPAPVIHSEGRQFPVDVRYGKPWQPGENPVPGVVSAILEALAAESGSVLVFLPGKRDIRAVEQHLKDLAQDPAYRSLFEPVLLAPLYGDMTLKDQSQAIAPAPAGQRKIVLATNIAESSLTIEGVRVVIDTGLCREPIYDPRTGMTRLQTRRISRASSIQRAGRAGRMSAGVCYRLWSEAQQDQMERHPSPEILQADLTALALQLACWGTTDLSELRWLDTPPPGAFQQACELLQSLGAFQQDEAGNWQVSKHGQQISALPVHPRIAHMLVEGARRGLASLASRIAALLVERDPLHGAGPDLSLRLGLFDAPNAGARRPKGKVQRLLALQRQFLEQLKKEVSTDAEVVADPDDERWLGFLLALAYPDRIGLRRKEGGRDYLLSSGRAARLPEADTLQQSEWIVVAQSGGEHGSRQDTIYLALPLDATLFERELAELVSEQTLADWDDKRERFVAETQRCIGKLVISRQVLKNVPAETKRDALLALLRRRGLDLLPWTPALRQWQARVVMLRQLDLVQGHSSEWPDVSEQGLLGNLENWLGPYLDGVDSLSGFARLDLKAMLQTLLPWPLPQRLDELAPEKLEVPSGSRIAIDYGQQPPVLAVRLQEMFGASQTPAVAQGRVKLMLHLLSPAQRPLAVTQDLVSFWQGPYGDVKKDMKGRYPKHYWPDNPLEAEATRRAKPRK